MDGIVSQINRLTIVHSTVYSGADQTKHQSYASLAFGVGVEVVVGLVIGLRGGG